MSLKNNCRWCGESYSRDSYRGWYRGMDTNFCSKKCQHEYELAEDQQIPSEGNNFVFFKPGKLFRSPTNSKPKKKGCLIVIIAIVIIYALSQ